MTMHLRDYPGGITNNGANPHYVCGFCGRAGHSRPTCPGIELPLDSCRDDDCQLCHHVCAKCGRQFHCNAAANTVCDGDFKVLDCVGCR
jgi:hypothetical protein